MSSEALPHLISKEEVDYVLRNVDDLLVILRFGRDNDTGCMQLDDTLSKSVVEVSKMATVWLVDVEQVSTYTQYFDITMIPSTLFFYNGQHMKCDFGTPDHTKWVGPFRRKQDFLDLVEVFYRGAMHGKFIVTSPLDPVHTPQYTLLFKDY